jgi:uncharacterized protein (TIGR02611 family)
MQKMTDTKLQDSKPPAILPPGDRHVVLRHVRRVIVFILGISVLLAGIVMIVSPGPAVVVIPLGLGILATEFIWARRLLDSLKRRLSDAHTAASEAPLPRWVRFFLPKKAGDA